MGLRSQAKRNDTRNHFCHSFSYVKQLRALFAFLIFLASAIAQTPQQPANPPGQPQSGAQSSSPQPQQHPPAEPEHHITKQEADELFRAVDDILKFDSERTGLPIKHPVKRKLTSRAEVQKFFLDAFRDDESAKRLQQAELVLKKFGLIPRDSSLEGTLLALYTESVAGYYDPKTKTVNLLDWLDPESQKPVLAHELTHALQDQNFDLQKYFKTPKPKKEEYDVTTSELQTARVAVMEGQAAATMVDWLLADRGLSLATAPDVGRAMQAAMLSEGDAPIFSHAPLYLREDMKFPYTYGLNFTLDLLKADKMKAYSEPFTRPPNSTRQIMEPETYLNHEEVPPLAMPELDKVLGGDWQRFDVDSVGEFDVTILAREYGRTVSQARSLASAWRNSYYYAANKKSTKPSKPADIALLYVSRWSSPEAANHFADIYADALGTRYKEIKPVENQPGHWTSEEGDVFVERQGDVILITESFDPVMSKKLRDAASAALNVRTSQK
jgi:hypothetical protein